MAELNQSDCPKNVQQRPATADLVFRGKMYEVWQWEQTLANGDKITAETIRRPDTVLVLPVLPNSQVILTENIQSGISPVLRALRRQIEIDESPEEAARRVLWAKSGYTAVELKLWDTWQPVREFDWFIHLYVAHGLSTPSNAAPDAREMCNLNVLPIAALLMQNLELAIDDYDLLHKLYFARSDNKERQRVLQLLTPG